MATCPKLPAVPDLPPAALKVLAGIRLKAGASGIALQPVGGWPLYCGVSPMSVTRALAADLPGIQRTATRPRTDFEVTGNLERGFARVSPDWMILPPGPFYVLIALATFANQAGKGRFHNAAVAARSGVTVRSLQRHLATIEGEGYFWRLPGGWQIHQAKTGLVGMIPFDDLQRFGFRFEQSAFDKFWSRYPRKEAQKAAREAWGREARGIDPGVILRGLERHIEAWRDAPARLIPHPAKWIDGRRWEDEAPARVSVGKPGGFWDSITMPASHKPYVGTPRNPENDAKAKESIKALKEQRGRD